MRFLLLPFFFLFLNTVSAANTNIAGVVNSYAAVSSLSANSITVSSFSPTYTPNCGDRILIIQMKGADIITTNSASFGNISAINDAGNYEIQTVESVSGSVITFTNNLSNSYALAGIVQAVFVPHFETATVTSTLSANPWNGTTGGVLALECDSSLILNANVDVSNQGFRGGNYHLNSVTPPSAVACGFGTTDGNLGYDYGYLNASKQYAVEKGESICETSYLWGKGKQASGGGGGGLESGGGGGGSNAGAGGDGGAGNPASSNAFFCAMRDVSGKGGLSLNSIIAGGKVFLGGGSGAGNNGNTNAYYTGGVERLPAIGRAGGGIVLISAHEIIGNGNSVNANGENGYTPTATANNFGGSGGGAGGSILLQVNTFTTNVNVNAIGGFGSSVRVTTTSSRRRGAGGGGSGGVVWFSDGSTPANATVNVNGGSRGLSYYNTNTLAATHHGTNGATGISLFNLGIGGSAYAPLSISLVSSADTKTVSGTPLYFQNGGILVYLDPNGNNLGNTTASISVGSNGPFPSVFCPSNEDELYLARTFNVTPSTQPSSSCDLSLFITQTELDDFIALTNAQSLSYQSCWGAVNSINDLQVTVHHSSGNKEVIIPTATYVVCLDAWQLDISINEFSTFYIHSKGGIVANNLLPVELLSFNAKKINALKNELTWTSLTEINNAGFEVLRSTDGSMFEPIAWIEGAGNSNEELAYHFIDKLSLNLQKEQHLYYKLRQIDFDGKFDFSDVEVVGKYIETLKDNFSIFPNPAKDLIHVKSAFGMIDHMDLYDASGRAIMLMNNIRANQIALNIAEVQEGIYILKIQSNDELSSHRIVIYH